MTQFLELQTDAPVVVARLATGYVLDTLREGDDLKLVCDVQSNPPPMRVIWYHDVSRNRRKEGERRERESRYSAWFIAIRILAFLPAESSTGARCERRDFVGFKLVDSSGAHARTRRRVFLRSHEYRGRNSQPAAFYSHEMWAAAFIYQHVAQESLLSEWTVSTSRIIYALN